MTVLPEGTVTGGIVVPGIVVAGRVVPGIVVLPSVVGGMVVPGIVLAGIVVPGMVVGPTTTINEVEDVDDGAVPLPNTTFGSYEPGTGMVMLIFGMKPGGRGISYGIDTPAG